MGRPGPPPDRLYFPERGRGSRPAHPATRRPPPPEQQQHRDHPAHRHPDQPRLDPPPEPRIEREPRAHPDGDRHRRLLVQPGLLPGDPVNPDHRADPGDRRVDHRAPLLDRAELAGGQVLAGPRPVPEGGVVGHHQQQAGAVAGQLAGVLLVGGLPADHGPDPDAVHQQRLQGPAGRLVVGDALAGGRDQPAEQPTPRHELAERDQPPFAVAVGELAAGGEQQRLGGPVGGVDQGGGAQQDRRLDGLGRPRDPRQPVGVAQRVRVGGPFAPDDQVGP
jgi:hypothetical protein